MFRAIRSDGRPIGRMTGKPEVYPKPDNWIASVVFGQRDLKLSRSRLRGRDQPSGVFQSKVVVHGLAEFLLAAEIPLGCLNRCVSK